MLKFNWLSRQMSVAVVTGAMLSASLAPATAQNPSDAHHKQARPGQGQGQRQAQPQRQAPPPAQTVRPAQPPMVVGRPAAPPPQVYARPAAPQVYARPAAPQVYNRPAPRHEHHHDRGPSYGAGVAMGVGAAIIGATLGYRYYRGPDRETVYDRCQRNYTDFDWDSGTFENEDGDRELCPYLRPYLD